MQLGTAGDLGDGACQKLFVLATRVAAARSELLRIAALVFDEPRGRLQKLEVGIGSRLHSQRQPAEHQKETGSMLHTNTPYLQLLG